MALVLWFAGLIGLVIAAGVASGRGRATPNDVFGRGVIAVAAVAYLAVIVSAVWVWGGGAAATGRAARLQDGVSVSLTLRAVRVPLERTLSVGRGGDVDVRIAGGGEVGTLVQVELGPASTAATGTGTVMGGGGAARVGEGATSGHPSGARAGAMTAGATASGATASGATASGATASGATASGATASGATASGATASGATASGAAASGAMTSGATTPGGSGPGGTSPGRTISGAAAPGVTPGTGRGGAPGLGGAGTSGAPGAAAAATGRSGALAPDGATLAAAGRSVGSAPGGSAATGVAREAVAAAGTGALARRALVRAVSPSIVLAPVPLDATAAAVATAIATSCTPDPAAAYTLPVGATVVAVECERGRAQRAVAVRRGGAAVLEVTPLVWRGRFVPERLLVKAGDALRVGGGDEPIPGVNTWDVIAPRGASGMVAVPADPTDCAAWSLDPEATRDVGGGCEVDAGAFVVQALPLVPHPGIVIDRGARAAFAIGAPPLALLIALGLARRRGRRAHVLARSLRLCALGAGLVALASWRLLWAYRIDVMRELSALGSRVADNQLAVAAIGAALAGSAAFALEGHDGRSAARRAGIVIVAWVAWLVVAWVAVDLGSPEFGARTLGVLALSLAAALVPLGGELARRASARLGPDAALAAIAAAAMGARVVMPGSPLLKLGLAYLVVLAGHAALRIAVEPETTVLRRARCLATLGAAALAVASLDAGVALAVIGTGLALAMLVAGHDATYDASKALRLGVLEREHARLILVHASAAIALAIGVAAMVLGASDREMLEHGADAVMYAPLVFAVLFAVAALVARSHRRGWLPWLAAALAALAVWGARDAVLERVTAGDHTGAHRVSALVEPGYALLRDERAFAANVSAWQEATLAPVAEVDLWRGQGYFGARVRDAGVGRSIDNDYLPVLVAREGGVFGLIQGIALLLVIVVGGGVLASVRLRHASREHRARWLVTAVVGTLAVYQPLASLGVLPLTGISWPGLGVDSPADLWLFVIGAVWCYLGAEAAVGDDERVRQTPRLARARRVAIAALAVAGIAAVVVVARAGVCALGRVTGEDARIETALQYADTIKCEWPERAGSQLEELVPALVAGTPGDDGTARFERELRAAWLEDRPKLLDALRGTPPSPAVGPVRRPDGSGSDGQGVDGRGADGRGADGRGADGRGADVRGVDARGADGRGADGRAADGRAAEGRGADVRGADGRGADGRGVDNRGADVRAADVRAADVRAVDGRAVDGRAADGRAVDGRGADGRGADGRGADGRDADGRGVVARSADSQGVAGWRADVRDTDSGSIGSWQADDRGADDRGADDRGADVRGADDRGADGLPGTAMAAFRASGVSSSDDARAVPTVVLARNAKGAGKARPKSEPRAGGRVSGNTGEEAADKTSRVRSGAGDDGERKEATNGRKGGDGRKSAESTGGVSAKSGRTGADAAKPREGAADLRVRAEDGRGGVEAGEADAAGAADAEGAGTAGADGAGADGVEGAATAGADGAGAAGRSLDGCRGRHGRWHLAREGDACVATFRAGWPEVRLAVQPHEAGLRATCAVTHDDSAVAVLRPAVRAVKAPRIRVVSAAMGAAASDVGEVVAGARIVRLRPGAEAVELEAVAGLRPAGKVTIASGVVLEARTSPRGVVLQGQAELFVAGERAAWTRMLHAKEVALDRLTLIVAGAPERRAIVLFRPPRTWGDAAVVDPLLADETNRVGDRVRRAYPYGAALPEMGWVNPFDVDRSLGLDGWIHAAHVLPAGAAPACGTLTPPVIPRERVCAPNPLDGVIECRVALQPELALALRKLAGDLAEHPKPFTGRDVYPVRVGYAVLRGDTGELLAQANLVPGRAALAYAPANPDAEAALVRLREERGESDAERVEWNLPIAIGSTFKPIVARAAELAFPRDVARLNLGAVGTASGCRARRGTVGPVAGHCPPTSVAGTPNTADVHDFLARSPNWYQMALGLIGLGLPDARLAAGETPVSLTDITGADLGAWPTTMPLTIADADGPILGKRGLSIAGMRRTPLWQRIERLLGRAVCTLGDRASCQRAAARADVCAARALPIASPGADLRYLVALGPDRLDPYGDDRPAQASVPVREYLQLLRGSGVHAVGSLAQLADAFGRVVYDPEAKQLAASWFPAPKAGALPDWTCTASGGHAAKVLGDDGGLCGVLRPGGTAHAAAGALLADPAIVVYGAKTGTIDSLAEIARRPKACAAWNTRHDKRSQLECGKAPPDDSLFVIAFGVVTPKGTIPLTLAIQLQRAGSGAAARSAPSFVREIAKYLRGA